MIFFKIEARRQSILPKRSVPRFHKTPAWILSKTHVWPPLVTLPDIDPSCKTRNAGEAWTLFRKRCEPNDCCDARGSIYVILHDCFIANDGRGTHPAFAQDPRIRFAMLSLATRYKFMLAEWSEEVNDDTLQSQIDQYRRIHGCAI